MVALKKSSMKQLLIVNSEYPKGVRSHELDFE